MGKERKTLGVRVDWYTRTCLTVIAVLLTVLIVGLWADYTPSADQAGAALRREGPAKPFVDNSTQAEIVQVTRAQDRTTAKIGELITLLQSGQVKVQVAPEGRGKGGTNGPAKAGK